ncbi:MAG: hypothetical protein F6K18_05230 [Okeania sp. SIO2C2]|uniref:hypothetical protein n=1 Tax=Okeania sp. SIO2C2 TaxID=2607787 RepID=UPI0013BBC830|nr:hypothetical protein [Okeania sp. SIO2C2]NEP86272.1 hypothetical protein [Okeania sp. SIO2C2]
MFPCQFDKRFITFTNACHQSQNKRSLDNQSRATYSHKSIDDFQVGQKGRVDGLQVTIIPEL